MTELSLFDWAADALERHSSWNRVEARGVLRLALQKDSLDPKTLSSRELADLLANALPQDLEARGMRDAGAICKKILAELPSGHLAGAAGPGPGPAAAAPAAPPVLFDWVSDAIDARTQMGRMQARGTLRLALKEAGLTAEEATREQTAAVLAQLMPRFLRTRGISDPKGVCGQILNELAATVVTEPAAANESPEEIFRRLGSRGT